MVCERRAYLNKGLLTRREPNSISTEGDALSTWAIIGCACDATPFIHVALNGRDRSPLSRSRSGSRLSLLDISVFDTLLRSSKRAYLRHFRNSISKGINWDRLPSID
jgi:hypothetical protein